MWATLVIAAIALTGAGFMLWFLVALLRECAPSVVPVRRERQKERDLGNLGGIYVRENGRAIESGCGDYSLGSVGKENYAEEECSSSLIAFDVRPVTNRLGWRSIYPRRGYVFRERRF
jgi:hypothetical protein